VVILNHGSLTLKDGNCDSGLLILVGGEGLRLLGGDHSSSVNNLGHDASDGLDTESKRGYIDKEEVLGLF